MIIRQHFHRIETAEVSKKYGYLCNIVIFAYVIFKGKGNSSDVSGTRCGRHALIPNADNLDSNELIELAKNGQKQAFGMLVKRHYGTVMYYLLGYGVKKADAEDITQEAFINAFRKIDQFRTSGSFVGWLLRIAKNQHIDKLRKEKKFNITGSELDLLNLPDDRTPEIQVVSDATVDALYSGLKPQEKVLLDLRVFQQMPFCEIAEILGSSEGNTRLIFHRLIIRLRKQHKS